MLVFTDVTDQTDKTSDNCCFLSFRDQITNWGNNQQVNDCIDGNLALIKMFFSLSFFQGFMMIYSQNDQINQEDNWTFFE